MVRMIADTANCKAWQRKAGKTVTTLEITRNGVMLETYTQHGVGYYTRKTEQLASGNASVLGLLVVFATYEHDALITAAVDYLAQSANLRASDTIADLFIVTLFD